MKKRRRSPLFWVILLALACCLELFILECTFMGNKPAAELGRSLLSRIDTSGATANASSQKMYVWKDASGVTHITETPPPDSMPARQLSLTPAPPPAQEPLSVSPDQAPALPSTAAPATSATPAPPAPPGTLPGIDSKLFERLRHERAQLEQQLYRARSKGDGYSQIRFRKLLEENRLSLEKLAPQGLEHVLPK